MFHGIIRPLPVAVLLSTLHPSQPVDAADKVLRHCPEAEDPPPPPDYATDLNGIAWPDFCLEDVADEEEQQQDSPAKDADAEEHFFVIGDWGGLFQGPGNAPVPADHHKRPFVDGVDDVAQLLVAEQMKLRANSSRPRFVLNVGDNLYWGGLPSECGNPTTETPGHLWATWDAVFEHIYDGPFLENVPWMGVLGNHDYGGYKFVTGWDQFIAYTWGPSGRWLTPALYWSTKVHYSDFTVLLLFVDSNVNDAYMPLDNPDHNMCSERNNPPNASCDVTGPESVWDCTFWFQRLWAEQIPWMEDRFKESPEADWRIVVTHFPPQYNLDVWGRLGQTYKIDLIVTGHRHEQDVSGRDPKYGGAAVIVSGGGGGVTSEGGPRRDGQDDQYGFIDVTISKLELKMEAISHGGVLRRTILVASWRPRHLLDTNQSGEDDSSTNNTGSSTGPMPASCTGLFHRRGHVASLLLLFSWLFLSIGFSPL